MKNSRYWLTFLLCFPLLAGCGSGTIDDPPEFVEMRLEDDKVVVSTSLSAKNHLKMLGEYDEDIYSHMAFTVVVETSGLNYDLLYSVELNDSLLGPCVYTDQSDTYHAASNITVEADQSYTTTVSLTIPGSTVHDTYLSDRTITLTKILFSRDTVDGTFPADIPENATKVLNFQVHAVDYLDSDLGYQVQMTDGLIDVVIKPDTPEYTSAETAGETDFVIPAEINGYAIRSVFLQDLDWITSLTINGASEDVFILGEFPLLTTMAISGLLYEPPALDPLRKHLTINGRFDLLTTITIEDCDGYNLFLAENTFVENDDYDTYKTTPGGTLYDFPELATLTINDSSLNWVWIGYDNLGYPFPKLATLSGSNFHAGEIFFGKEANAFTKLTSFEIDEGIIGNIHIAGNKPESETPALLSLTEGTYDYIDVKGSLVGNLDLTGSTVKTVQFHGGTTYPSALASFVLDGVTFGDFSPSIVIDDHHPNLTTIELRNMPTLNVITIGTDVDEFDNLETIACSHIAANSIHIGLRETEFPKLTELSFDDVALTGDLRIGDEGSTFPLLEEITITNSSFANLRISRLGDYFATLGLIYLNDVTMTGACEINYIHAPYLETVVLIDVAAASLIVAPLLDETETYAVYIDGLDLDNNPNFNSDCGHIYLNLVDVTSWEYYTAVNALGIPMSTGTYSPS